MVKRPSLNEYFEDSIKSYWNQPSLSDFNGNTLLYRDVARKIAKLHLLYEHCGVMPGDRIALCGRNSAAWGVAFLSVLTYGAVAVPILHDFKADTIHHLVNHSEAKLLFTNSGTWENLDPQLMPAIKGAILIRDFSMLFSRCDEFAEGRAHLNEMFGHRYPERFTVQDVKYAHPGADEVCLINYTSGSTGFSKGVMLTNRNLWSNLEFALGALPKMEPGDGMVCMLPMAHMYGLMIDFIFGFTSGCHLHMLTRNPSPRVITEAFAKIQPKIIVSVPLIIEKIIRTQVFPLLDKPLMRILLHVPFVDDRLLGRIKESLRITFGGRLEEMIIGGAGLNKDVESFLRKINFPYTSGYGMTECGPLISYVSASQSRLASCGIGVSRMALRIDSPDPENVPGVLYVKGDNVMKGYYKNEKATRECLSVDGWLYTGDIGCIDSDGYLYLRGRDKNMILGPSGQNIYPEEIEQKLNNMSYVNESLVIEEDGYLVALVYPDFDNTQKLGISLAEIEQIMDDNLTQLNRELPGYSKVKYIRIYHEEFEKTPKRSIKRYLYQRKPQA